MFLAIPHTVSSRSISNGHVLEQVTSERANLGALLPPEAGGTIETSSARCLRTMKVHTPAYVAAALRSALAVLCPLAFCVAIRKTALPHPSGWQVRQSAQLLCARMCFVILGPTKLPLSLANRNAQRHPFTTLVCCPRERGLEDTP